jgi:tetratricopeptide (TPR) repeat protein
LIELHPKAAAAAQVPARKLVDWMMEFQFCSDPGYFELDPVDYAPALGDAGIAMYREALTDHAANLGERPAPSEWRSGAPSLHWFAIEWNERRLAVLDRDVDRIIETHLCRANMTAGFLRTAEALEEIGEHDLAIEWAKRATDSSSEYQAELAGRFWSDLLAKYQPEQATEACVEVFQRWPSASNATYLCRQAGEAWSDYEHFVMSTLARWPREAVRFARTGLKDASLAWRLAHDLGLDCLEEWEALVKDYQKIDPLATLQIHRELVENALQVANTRRYRRVARRLATMRKLAAGTEQAAQVDQFIAQLRETYRRRTRLQYELNLAGLP